jgi:hypothetical protein
MRAHSKLIELGYVNFYSQTTVEVAQRVLRESSEDSNGERENDALSKALQTKEQRGRAHGVFSKVTWKMGFSQHKSMYQKQKMASTPQVDVGGAEKKAEKQGSRRLEAYIGDLRYTIP